MRSRSASTAALVAPRVGARGAGSPRCVRCSEGAAAVGHMRHAEAHDVLGRRPSMRSPAKRISPCVRTMSQSARSVVVLPAPLAPSSAVMPPSRDVEVDAVQHLRRRRSRACRPRTSSSASAISSCAPQVGADHVRVALHLGRRALGDLAAEVQRHDLVGDAHHQAHVVLDQQHGELERGRGCRGSAPPSASTSSWLRPARRLVEQQQLAARAASARAELDALLRAERQVGTRGAPATCAGRAASISSSARALARRAPRGAPRGRRNALARKPLRRAAMARRP